MDEANFFWEIFAALVSAGWVVTVFIRDRISQSLALSSALLTRLMEYEKISLENPEIQKYLSQNAKQDEVFFEDEKNLEEDIFYQAKTLVYTQLNLFDEILAISAKTGGSWTFLRPVALVEKADWDEYIKEKLRHPFYRSILNNEKHIFGAALRTFWKRNKKTIESNPADPFIW